MLVKAKMAKNGRCLKGSRHIKGRPGCWRPSKTHMSGKKK